MDPVSVKAWLVAYKLVGCFCAGTGLPLQLSDVNYIFGSVIGCLSTSMLHAIEGQNPVSIGCYRLKPAQLH